MLSSMQMGADLGQGVPSCLGRLGREELQNLLARHLERLVQERKTQRLVVAPERRRRPAHLPQKLPRVSSGRRGEKEQREEGAEGAGTVEAVVHRRREGWGGRCGRHR